MVVIVSGSNFVLVGYTTFRYLDAKGMAQALGDAKWDGLTAFHAFTGYDVTSSFVGKGKRTAWTAW